jgi:hypothetical protein
MRRWTVCAQSVAGSDGAHLCRQEGSWQANIGWGGPWTVPVADAIRQIVTGFTLLLLHLGQID